MSSLRQTVAKELRTRILAGEWAPGDRLPSEPRLAHERGVSRDSIRAAITMLEEGGYVVRRRGSGTYVREWVAATTLDLARDLAAGCAGEEAAVVPAPPMPAEALGLPPGAFVGHARGVRIGNGRRVIDTESWWRLDQRGHEPDRRVVRVLPRNADGEVAARLAVPLGTLVMTVEQVGLSRDGRAIVVTQAHCVAEAFEFTASVESYGSTRPRRIA